eukprot:TRINITY_DN10608_c0_g1_i1.p2 TRINITY_DN10608_c0_g1~~TRINITY_DN10608_c0_g1_i1.p2  ORF type:complete len:179 (-),score=45.87 TRINITY_DN10608_c0_g1_i1:8-544(-)
MTTNLVQDEIRLSGRALRPSHALKQDSNGLLDKVSMEELEHVREETNIFLKEVVQPILKRHFMRDEFIGRINEMVVFHPFSLEDQHKIVEKELEKWRKKAFDRHGIVLNWENNLIQPLTRGFNDSYGFRSLKNEIEKRVINVLASAHSRGQIRDGCIVTMGIGKDGKSVLITDIQQKE